MATSPPNVYAPPKSTVADPTASEPFELAERGSRLGAVMLDGLLFNLPLLPLWIMVFPIVMHRGSPLSPSPGMLLAASLGGLIDLALFVYMLILLHRGGQTIGKKLVDIRIVRSDGSRATLGRIFWMRGFVSALPGMVPFLGHLYRLADILFIFGKPRRCIHDYIADTIVVKA